MGAAFLILCSNCHCLLLSILRVHVGDVDYLAKISLTGFCDVLKGETWGRVT